MQLALCKAHRIGYCIDRPVQNIYNLSMRPNAHIENISSIPQCDGVYFLKNGDNEIVYIGKARNLRSRINTHKQQKDAFKHTPERIESVEWVQTANEIEALIKEREYIQHYQPKLNVLLRDDKQWMFVGITKQQHPYIFLTHQPIQRNATKVEYIGPFTDGTALKRVMRTLRKSFPYYMTTNKQAGTKKMHSTLPCPYCHLGLCPGDEQTLDTKHYLHTISTIRQILTGKYSFVMKQIQKQIKECVKKQEFENASVLQKQYDSLHKIFTHHAHIADSPKLIHQQVGDSPSSAIYLAQLVGVELPVNTIEGYDISNLQGNESIASIVRFENGKPNKSLYRYMNIRSANNEPNDFLSLQEALARRLKHKEWSYPDLILLDGGKGQLSAGVEQLRASGVSIPIVALAKKQEELFLSDKKGSVLLSSMPQQVEHLLQHIRNEAHRFAITRHRAKHRKQFNVL